MELKKGGEEHETKMKNEFGEAPLTCPECDSQEVTVSHLQRFMANTGEHYCHSVETQDADSESTCLNCQWIGRRDQLMTHNVKLTAEHEAQTLMAKDFCKEIGCSGTSPDMCRNHPLKCSIVKKVMGG